MTTKEYVLSIVADVRDFREELAQMPGITKKEADKAANELWRALSKGQKKAGDEAKSAAKKAADSWEKVGKGEALKKIGMGLGHGGLVGDIEDLATGLAGLGPVAGGAALGIGAVTAATVLSVTAMVSAISAADELIEELEYLKRIEGFEPISPEAKQAIDDVNTAMAAVGAIVDELFVVFAAEFAPEIAAASKEVVRFGLALLDVVRAKSEAYNALRELAQFAVSTFYQALAAPATSIFSLIEALGWLGEVAGFEDNAVSRLGNSWDDFTDSLASDTIDAVMGLAEEHVNLEGILGVTDERVEKFMGTVKKETDRLKDNGKAAREAAQAAKELAAANEELAQIHRAAQLEQLSDEEKIIAQLDEQIRKTEELGSVTGKWDMVRLAQLDLQAAAQIKLGEIEDKRAEEAKRAAEKELKRQQDFVDKVKKGAEEAAKHMQKVAEQQAAMWEQIRNDGMAVANDVISLIASNLESSIGELEAKRETLLGKQESEVQDLIDMRERALAKGNKEQADALTKRIQMQKTAHEQELAQLEEETEKKKKAARAAFEIQRALALVQIVISTAKNIAEVSANPFAAAAVAGIGLAQTGVVLAQKPPEFHAGGFIRAGAPDEVDIRAKHGEGVLSTTGMMAIGGEAALNRLNRGESANQTIVVQQVYGHRVFDSFVYDNLQMNSALGRALRSGRSSGKRLANTRKHQGGQ